MRRLLLGASTRKNLVVHPLEKGDLCLAAPPPALASSSADSSKDLHLATVVSSKPPKVTFFDDGSGTVYDVAKISEAPRSEREAAKQRYVAALQEAKRLAGEDSEAIVQAAIAKVSEAMGGTLGADGMISYTVAAGDESREGQLLCEALLANFGPLALESVASAWMASSWRDVCAECDVDKSGTISEAEAALIWERVAELISSTITTKVDLLGAPPRLYRGDLCMAWPVEAECDPADPTKRMLGTYVDATHVTFLDGSDRTVSAVREVVPATPAAREQAILRYTKAVSQCKAIARRPSKEVITNAVEHIKEAMGGTLGADGMISYTNAAGDESREGQLLCEALVANFAALKSASKATAEIEANWKVACAQADADKSGTSASAGLSIRHNTSGTPVPYPCHALLGPCPVLAHP